MAKIITEYIQQKVQRAGVPGVIETDNKATLADIIKAGKCVKK